MLPLSLTGQLSIEKDTIEISEVIISSNRNTSDLSGFRYTLLDSATISNFSHSTLAGLLLMSSDIFVKSYGVGGAATPSLRGTGAGHTPLAWNDININNPMLGQSDLALIPAGFIDDANIYYGGSSMAVGSGGIGGIINIRTRPVWRDETVITLNPGIGSFGQLSGLVKIKTGSLNYQSVTKGYLQYAENDFRYLNSVATSEPVWEINKNNQTMQKGFLQELYFRKTRSLMSARIWYQSLDRNLPSSKLSNTTNNVEKQHDESLRSMLSFEASKGQIEYFLTGYFSISRLDYFNKLASIDSRNLSESLIMKTGIITRLGEFSRFKIYLDNDYTIVKTENYDNNISKSNIASLTALTEINGSSRLSATLLLREIIQNQKLLIPDFSTGLQLKLSDSRDYFLKTSFSRNSKLATMNDLYWTPGGNSLLSNESAYIYELGYEMMQRITSPLLFKLDMSLYHNTISDLIQWHPGQYSYWTADNVKSVNTSGIEASGSLNYNTSEMTSALKISYTYTSACTSESDIPEDASIGKQLVYNPENQANAILTLDYHGFSSYWISSYTGKRFITADNSKYLPGYLLNSISAGYKFHPNDNVFSLNLTVDNLFDTSYETIAYYPLPGRSFSVKLLIQFFK